jgi:DNA invertase Pin-like site-specific DNA recombinase
VVKKPVSVAYSYTRFSHPEQAKGDSQRRQAELRDGWLSRSPEVKLDTSLSLEDKGVSGFTGEHRDNPDRHALASFLALVKAGRIPRGAYLIVESLDRLSREDIIDALSLLLDLIRSDVRVVQLLPAETVYDRQSNPMHVMMAVMELSRGHSESAMKSERVGRAWQDKKRRAAENGEPLTKTAPAWLRLVDGKWELVAAAAAAVRRIFRLATDGYGIGAVAKKLNAEGVPGIGGAGTWHRGYVAKILRSRAVVGEYQPCAGRGRKRRPDGDPIPGYYPAVISEEEWYAARAAVAGRRGKAGRPAKGRTNLFAGLLYDARGGGPLQIRDHGKAGSGRVLVSYASVQGVAGADGTSFPLDAFEEAVLGRLREIDPRDVLPRGGDDAADKALALAGRLTELEAEIERVKARLETKFSDGLADVLGRHEAKRAKLAEELAAAKLEAASPLTEAWGNATSLLAVLESAPDPEGARLKLRAALRRVVAGIWCLFVGHGALRVACIQIWFTGDGRRDYIVLRRPARGHGPAESRHPARQWVRSLAEVTGPAPLDLRRSDHARRLEKALAGLDWDALQRESREQIRAERNRRRREQWEKDKDEQNRRRREQRAQNG